MLFSDLALWTEIGGTRCMFDTPESPLTQTFGLGLFEPVTAAIMDEIERFFQNHGAPVWHEVSPLRETACVVRRAEAGESAA